MSALMFTRLLFFLSLTHLAFSAETPFLQPQERVMFLGDSIAQEGRHIVLLDLLLRTRMPDASIQLIPLGLSSETVSGLSENHHPWPRPDIHERITRALEKAKPTTVIFCYGINDGIYAPFSEANFTRYQDGVKSLCAKMKAAGAKTVILTPPPFDAPSVKSALLPDGGGDYGYKTPWKDYDTVMRRYSSWLLDTPGLADKVIDIHGPITRGLRAWRTQDPQWKSGDGVHPVPVVYWLMASAIAEGLRLPTTIATLPSPTIKPDGSATWVFSAPAALPDAADAPRGFLKVAGYTANHLSISLPQATAAVWRLHEGGRLLAILTRDEVRAGVSLTDFPALSINRDASFALPTAMQRQKLLGGAWREHVGHTRPQTDRNFPSLEQALVTANQFDATIQPLLALRPITVTLEPIRP